MYLDTLVCPTCETQVGFDLVGQRFLAITGGKATTDGADGPIVFYPCSQREWSCNWLVRDNAPAGQCFSCRLTRKRPAASDTIALEKLAKTEESKRRLVLQLCELGLPISPWNSTRYGLGFDLLSSRSGAEHVTIGHSAGIITIDLAESLDDVREALRVRLGEPYRTMLGHLRHEVGHYFQNVLITDDATWAHCRELFGDEQKSYKRAIKRHYTFGAPANWQESFISEYATMHPWEDFAETFAHYLHIVGTLQTAASIGIRLEAGVSNLRDIDVVPEDSYRDQSIGRILGDWEWMSQAFNRINRSMGLGDLYPFTISAPVRRKLSFMHDLITRDPLTIPEQLALALAPAMGPLNDGTHDLPPAPASDEDEDEDELEEEDESEAAAQGNH